MKRSCKKSTKRAHSNPKTSPYDYDALLLDTNLHEAKQAAHSNPKTSPCDYDAILLDTNLHEAKQARTVESENKSLRL